MTLDEFRAVAKTLSFRGLLRQMRMHFVIHAQDGGAYIELRYHAFDATSSRARPEPFEHDGSLSADKLAALDEEGAIDVLDTMIGALLMHEIDEGLFVRGAHLRVPAGHGHPLVNVLAKKIAKMPRRDREALAGALEAAR